MALELPEFGRRFEKKLKKTRPGLKALLERTCEKDGTQTDPSTGRCPVCRAQIVQIERDPVPADVLRPVDPAKSELQKQFYARLERQRKEREQEELARQQPKKVELLPGESLPDQESATKRDWSKYIGLDGFVRRW
jgi:uncharacterized Zn finger protein (UPF0148 family)